ncbi:MAG: hypothetical protein QOE09_3667 [Ilumatobacteraceae bacterium]
MDSASVDAPDVGLEDVPIQVVRPLPTRTSRYVRSGTLSAVRLREKQEGPAIPNGAWGAAIRAMPLAVIAWHAG